MYERGNQTATLLNVIFLLPRFAYLLYSCCLSAIVKVKGKKCLKSTGIPVFEL